MLPEPHPELVQRMRNTIEAMEHIQRELSQPATDPQTGRAAPQVALETVTQLKCCVDQFRLFLWAYVDARGSVQPSNPNGLTVDNSG